MDILWDVVKVLGRIITILPFMLFIGLFMGRRSIGELPVFDFLVILVLGSLVGADIADPKINHIHTVVAMVAIALVQKVIIYIKLKNRSIGRKLTFEPTVVIYKGEFLIENLKKINYAIDNILQMLREKNAFHVKDVDIAIVEANGSLSVRMVSEKEPVTRGDMGIIKAPQNYEIPVILDGIIQQDILRRINKNEAWVKGRLSELNISSESNVFYGSVDSKGNLHVTLKLSQSGEVPPIFH